MQNPFENQLPIKCQPELRHVLAHLSDAVEALAKGRPIECLDNLKSVEGLIFFMLEDENGSEEFYTKELKKWELIKTQNQKQHPQVARRMSKNIYKSLGMCQKNAEEIKDK